MSVTESLKQRRTYYNINKELPVKEDQVISMVQELTELVPDAFNMKSSFVAVALGAKQDLFGILFTRHSADRLRGRKSMALRTVPERCCISMIQRL